MVKNSRILQTNTQLEPRKKNRIYNEEKHVYVGTNQGLQSRLNDAHVKIQGHNIIQSKITRYYIGLGVNYHVNV